MALVTTGDFASTTSGRATCRPRTRTSLRHLSRIPPGSPSGSPLYLASRTREEAMAVAASLPLRYAVGGGRRYSDLGLIITGAVVERVTGERLDAAVRRLVTEPLGMTSTGVRPGRAGDGRRLRARGRHRAGDDPRRGALPGDHRAEGPRPASAATGSAVRSVTATPSTRCTGYPATPDSSRSRPSASPVGSSSSTSPRSGPVRFSTFLVPGPDGQALPGSGRQPAGGWSGIRTPGVHRGAAPRRTGGSLGGGPPLNRLHVMAPGDGSIPDIAPDWQAYLRATGFSV